jgi:hypothetical protein
VDQAWTSAEAPRALAELFLKACALGAPCGDLALALAEAVIDAAGVGLAVEVLAGGEHQIARATELAARVLDAEATADAVTRSEATEDASG